MGGNFSLRFRDRPFNLKWGGYGFLFRSEFFFLTKQELEYLFFLSRKARIFFSEINIRLYDKNSESDYLFFSSTRIFFSATLGIRIFFLEKNQTVRLYKLLLMKLILGYCQMVLVFHLLCNFFFLVILQNRLEEMLSTSFYYK